MSDGEAAAGRPAATVVVCTLGRPELLAGCLESVAAAMRAGDELIVVSADGAGLTDPTADLEVAARWLQADQPGKSRQLNQAVRAAKGEIVVITDDDCVVAPGWVDGMVGAFASADVGAAFGPVRGLSSVPGPAAPVLPAGPAPIEYWVYAHGAAMAIRRPALVEVGGFDERLGPGAPAHGEEGDVVLRLVERGWTCRIAGAPVVEHREWRSADEEARNLLVYERGSGALLGAALRRRPARSLKPFVLRLRYQGQLWLQPGLRGWAFGPRTLIAFLRGVIVGLGMRPQRWL